MLNRKQTLIVAFILYIFFVNETQYTLVVKIPVYLSLFYLFYCWHHQGLLDKPFWTSGKTSPSLDSSGWLLQWTAPRVAATNAVVAEDTSWCSGEPNADRSNHGLVMWEGCWRDEKTDKRFYAICEDTRFSTTEYAPFGRVDNIDLPEKWISVFFLNFKFYFWFFLSVCLIYSQN